MYNVEGYLPEVATVGLADPGVELIRVLVITRATYTIQDSLSHPWSQSSSQSLFHHGIKHTARFLQCVLTCNSPSLPLADNFFQSVS